MESEDLIEGFFTIHQGPILNPRMRLATRCARRTVFCFHSELQQILSSTTGDAIDAMNPLNGSLLVRNREGHRSYTKPNGIVTRGHGDWPRDELG